MALYYVAPSAVGPTGTTGHGRAAEASRLRMPTLAPPAAGPARGPWAAGGPEEQRDSDWLHGLCRDEVTVCFHYLYRRSRLVMSRRNFLSKLLSSEE